MYWEKIFVEDTANKGQLFKIYKKLSKLNNVQIYYKEDVACSISQFSMTKVSLEKSLGRLCSQTHDA